MADFSVALKQDLEEHALALPDGFNQDRFVANAVALMNGNDTLQKFVKDNPQTGLTQIKSGMLRGAFLGLDFLNREAYLVPYGSKLDYQTSYIGEIKLRKKYSVRPIRDIYADVVRKGDDFAYEVVDGEPTLNHKPLPFNSNEVIGAYAVCIFEDGGKLIDTMSLADLENTRSASKAKNSPAWSKFTNEMYKKTVIRRLCKTIDMDLSTEQRTTLDEEMEIATSPTEIRDNDVEATANTEEFIDVDAEVVDDQIEGQMSFEDLK